MILAATGHRPSGLVFPEGMDPYGPEANRLLYEFALKELPIFKATEAISGMALGWDQAFAHACVTLKIPFTAAVPFVGQESRWTPRQQDRYRKLLARAAKVEVVSKGGYTARAMLARDEWMVERAQCLCAMYNGQGKGGTAHTVAYASGRQVLVINLWERWGEHLKEGSKDR